MSDRQVTTRTGSTTDPATRATLALVLTHGLGPRLIARAIEKCGSAEQVIGATAAKLGEVDGISTKNAGKMKRAIDEAAAPGGAADRELELAAKHKAVVLSINAPGYPALLKVIPDAPPVLWVKGKLSADDALSLAIVGSRKCSHYGREQADCIANGLAHSGVTIVSGGAYGIDIAAHEGAIRAAKLPDALGRTIAVLGSGLAKPYPAEHVDMLREIVAEDGSRGAVVSEFPMMTVPKPENFLRRNRIISGLSLGVLVVEAGKRSGALSTARRCVEEHGRELMALPGRVDSPYAFGCHQIIREGWGQLVTGVSDILDVIGGESAMLQAAQEWSTPDAGPMSVASQLVTQANKQSQIPASDIAKKILETLDEPRSLDEIASWTGLAAGTIQGELTMLEIRGAVKREGGLFVRRR